MCWEQNLIIKRWPLLNFQSTCLQNSHDNFIASNDTCTQELGFGRIELKFKAQVVMIVQITHIRWLNTREKGLLQLKGYHCHTTEYLLSGCWLLTGNLSNLQVLFRIQKWGDGLRHPCNMVSHVFGTLIPDFHPEQFFSLL